MKYTVVEGPESERTAWILHGILGAGRNWRGFARQMRRLDPTWRYITPDLRNHGATGPVPGPHDLEACARDLEALPRPNRVIGHSFGGKVALAYAKGHEFDGDVWVLDSIPVAQDPGVDSEVMRVLHAIRTVPEPIADRADAREVLTQAGLPKMLVDWVLTSLRRTDTGWEWMYGLDGISPMMDSYFTTDFGPWLRTSQASKVHLVRAMNSDRWTPDILAQLPEDAPFHLHPLANAGHWLHVDNPTGLLQLLLP